MAVLRVRLLGSPDIRVAEERLSFRNRKALALMIYLMVERGRHLRDHLSTLFWPNSDASHARTALRSALAMLREALDTAQPNSSLSYLMVDRESIGFVCDALDLDLAILQNSLEASNQALDSPTALSDPKAQQQQIQMAQQGLALYRGEFLQGFSLSDAPDFEEWLRFQRESYHRRISMLFDRASLLALDCGRSADAAELAARWVIHDTLDEVAHLRLMQTRFAAGDRGGALRAYDFLQKYLRRELHATPGPEIEALAARLRQDAANMTIQPRAAPALPTLALVGLNGPLVGRAAEYARLIHSYRLTQQHGLHIIILLGETGIGKSRLVAEYLGWAAAQGADILQGCAFEVGGRLPYQPLVDMLRIRLDQERAPDDLLNDIWLAELSRLLPELCDRYPDLPHTISDEATARTRLFEAVVCLGQALAARKPVIVFVDDLHWADLASRDLLVYAIRRWKEMRLPIQMILSVRIEALIAQPDLDVWVSNLQRANPITRLQLGPHNSEDTIELIQRLSESSAAQNRLQSQSLPADKALLSALALTEQHSSFKKKSFAHWLYSETAGQPLYMIETLQALIEQGYLPTYIRSSGELGIKLELDMDRLRAMQGYLPSGVRNLIQTRLRQISVRANTLLAAAAVLGQRVIFERLCYVADLDESTSLTALDELLHSHLLKELRAAAIAEHDYYLFVHDKIRDVIYAELSEARRRVFHRRAFEVLQKQGLAADLIRHALQAGLRSQAVKASIAAGDEAMAVFAMQDALSYYQQALALLKDHPQDLALQSNMSSDDWWHLWAALGRVYVVSADWDAALANYHAMLAFAHSARNARMECEALVCMANVALHQSFDLSQANTLLQQALTVAEQSGDPTALAQTEWNLAQSGYYAWDLSESLAHAERAFKLAQDAGLPELSARSLYAMANARWRLGQWEASQEHAQAAYQLYHSLGDRAMQCAALHLLGRSQIHLGDPLAGIASTRTAYTLSLEIGYVWATIQSASTLCVGLREIGEYAEAIQHGEEALRQARLKQNPVILFMALGALGTTFQEALLLDEAAAIFQEAQILGDSIALRPYTAILASMHCAVAAMRQDWDEATSWALRALKARDPSSLHLTDWSRWYETEALLRGGYVSQAQDDVQRFGLCVASNRRYRIPYLRSQAVLASWEHDDDQALVCLREAAELASSIGLPGDQWRIAAAIGSIQQQLGQYSAAEAAFKQVARIRANLAQHFGDTKRHDCFLRYGLKQV